MDIITFAESPDYLGLPPLYPRQKLILKVTYGLPLTTEEKADLEYLCTRKNKYAQAVVHPGPVHLLLIVAGRGSGKTTLESIISAYETYELLRLGKPQRHFGFMPSAAIHIQNVATDEKQSLLLFNEYKALLENSPWFKKIDYQPLEREVRFPGRIIAESLHSNSRSTRGRNTRLALFDEFAFTLKTAGAASGKSLWSALTGSVKTRFINRGHRGLIVVVSSPGEEDGMFWELYDAAPSSPGTAMFQLATWEMIPGLTKDDYAADYAADPVEADREYGAQFVAQNQAFLPPEAVDQLFTGTERHQGQPGYRYVLHLDPGIKRNAYAAAIAHMESRGGRIVVVVDKLMAWVGDRSCPVDIDQVERWVLAQHALFNFARITFDQFNSAQTILHLQKAGLPAVETTFTASYNYTIYSNLLTLVLNRQLELYDYEPPAAHYPGLRAQLKALRRIQRGRTYQVSAPTSGRVQEDDLADAVAAAAYQAMLVGEDAPPIYETHVLDYRELLAGDDDFYAEYH
ncbi:MAG: hypothetical protein IMW94_01490 [Thermoanaerobacter sp.]|nr:hypothetical protein [Thermoanaerobacter sp.]